MEAPATTARTSARIGAPRLQGLIRPLGWIALALALYAGLGFIAAPLLATHFAPPFLHGLFGREVSIGAVGFNPFTLSAEIRDVRIMQAGGADAGPPAVALDRLGVNLEISSLWHGGPVVRELAIEGPRIRLVRLDAGRYDFSDVLDRLGGGATGEGDEPLRFSVANIHVDNGLVEMDDRVAGSTHRLSGVKLGLPFISNLPVEVDVFIEPDLSALLDNRPLNAKGHLKPFAGEGKNEITLSLVDFDLPPWLVYLPFDPAFRLSSGKLGLDLHVVFEQDRGGGGPTVSLQGKARVDGLAIQDRAGRSVLSVSELEAELADVQPLLDHYYFSRLRLQQPELDLVRLAGGGFNLASLLPASSRKTAPAGRAGTAKKDASFDFRLSSARIRDGLIRYSDNALPGGFSTRLEGISLDLRDLASGSDVPAVIRLDYTTASREKFSHQDRLRLKPTFEYSGNLVVEDLQPALYGRYYADMLPGGEIRHGRAGGTFHYRIQASPEVAGASLVEIGIERLALADFALALAGRKGELLRVRNFTLSDTAILPASRKIRVGGVNAKGMSLAVARAGNGEFDFMALAGRPSRAGEPPWTFQLDDAAVSDASLRFEDRIAGAPAVLTADGIELKLSDLSTVKGARGANLALQGRIGKDGRLTLKGTVAPEPLRADLNIDLQGFSLPAAQPYIAQQARSSDRRENPKS